MMKDNSKPTFAPLLYVKKDGAAAVEFYKKALGAVELRRFSNDDGTLHVSELEIAGSLFRLHEEKTEAGQLSPQTAGGVTAVICLMVDDPDALMAQAVAAGGEEISPMQDYDYGYRQGDMLDPFGHLWTFEKVI